MYCPELTSVKVTSAKAVMALVRKGDRNRTVRQTEMNEHSSRSHTIIQLRVEQRTAGGGGSTDPGLRQQVRLVDLAVLLLENPDAMEAID